MVTGVLMGIGHILLLVLFLIILGLSCALLVILFRMKQVMCELTGKMQDLKDEAKTAEDETDQLRNKIQQLTNETESLCVSLAKIESRLNESDRKNEENRKTLKMLMISDLGDDIDILEKKDTLDEKLRVLLKRVKENISKTENM